jgi:hypothetical protein
MGMMNKKYFEYLLKNLEQVQERNSDYGASDTEPNYVVQTAMVDATEGKEFNPITPEEWQLFTCVMDCKPAAVQLNMATLLITEFIRMHKKDTSLMAMVKEKCWRINR